LLLESISARYEQDKSHKSRLAPEGMQKLAPRRKRLSRA
jgi:hypothetical protein